MAQGKIRLKRIVSTFCVTILTISLLAQNPQRISMKLTKVSISEALQKIKSQTDVRFIYNNEEVNKAGDVSINVTNVTITNVLNALLRNKALTYEKQGKNSFIIKPLRYGELQNNGMRIITGKIIDSKNGEALIGASIIDPNSKKGGITGSDGTFTLRISGKSKSITSSYVGYDSKHIAINNNKPLIIELDESSNSLNDIVVIGYGSTTKKDLTGSVASVKAKDIQNIPTISIDEALYGKASGVQITKADGAPGGAVRIRVRGGSSIRGNQEPLYIIDGIPTEIKNNYISGTEMVNPIEAANNGENFDNTMSGSFMRGLNNLAGLNVNDIEEISILKDASATAIYGSKAANGVVIIKTKRGKYDMKPQFNLNYYFSASTPLKEKLLNGQQYKEEMSKALTLSNANMAVNGAEAFKRNIDENNKKLAFLQGINNADTDWLDLVTRTGLTQNVDFSVTGGGDKSRYYTSFSYTNQTGTLISTDFERYTVKSNIDNNITDKFRMGTNLSFNYKKNDITNGVYSQALLAPPVLSPYNEDGTYANYSLIPELAESYMGFQNPLAVASGLNQAKTYNFKGSVYAEVDILKNLKFKSMLSIDYSNYTQSSYIPSYVSVSGVWGTADSDGGQGTQSQSNSTSLFYENTLSYNKTFNDNHRLDAIIGTSWEEQKASYFSASGKGYPDDKYLNGLSSAQTATSVAGADPSSQNSLLSFYVRANYVLKDRYLFTFTGRSDNSSKFAKNNRIGYFPSGAIAWRLNEEAFMKRFTWIDELKLRASIGKSGTQSIADHMFRTLYSPGAYAGSAALYPTQLGNNDIKWESTIQKDLGLDFAFFNNRLTGTLAYYHKVTDGALLGITPAPSSGFPSMTANIAKIRNSGIEFDLGADLIRTNNWKWNASFNISHNSSKVLKLLADNTSSSSEHKEIISGTTLYREGESLGLMYGTKAVGILKTKEAVEDYKKRSANWKGMSPDLGIGSIELALNDRGYYYSDIIGNSTPDFYGGITSTLQYKNWSLMSSFTYSYGNDLIYQKDVSDMNFDSFANRGLNVQKGTTPDHITNRPAVLTNGYSSLTNLNVYDASYFKLQTLSLSYAIPNSLIKKLHLQNLSLYATASNLFTITSYPGPDPAVSDDPYSVSGGGRDVSSYPTCKSYTVGLKLGF